MNTQNWDFQYALCQHLCKSGPISVQASWVASHSIKQEYQNLSQYRTEKIHYLTGILWNTMNFLFSSRDLRKHIKFFCGYGRELNKKKYPEVEISQQKCTVWATAMSPLQTALFHWKSFILVTKNWSSTVI